MANEIVGLDWAASGLKVAVHGLDRRHFRRWGWDGDVAEPPRLGEGDASALRDFVNEHRLENRPARVAIQRRDLLILSCRSEDAPEEIERILPHPSVRWHWTSAASGDGVRVVIAVEQERLRALERFVESAGLRFSAAVFAADTQGGGAITIDAGMNETRVLHRLSDGQLRVQRTRRHPADIADLVRGARVTTAHLTGGGALEATFVSELRGRLACEVVPPRSTDDAIFGAASMAATGGGITLCAGTGIAVRRFRTWLRAAAALSLTLACGSSAAAARADRLMKARQTSAEVILRAAVRGETPSSEVLGRALASIPDAVTLSAVDLDATARLITLEGAAASHPSVALMIERLAAASFTRPRCVKAALDEAHRVRFSVAAGYEH